MHPVTDMLFAHSFVNVSVYRLGKVTEVLRIVVIMLSSNYRPTPTYDKLLRVSFLLCIQCNSKSFVGSSECPDTMCVRLFVRTVYSMKTGVFWTYSSLIITYLEPLTRFIRLFDTQMHTYTIVIQFTKSFEITLIVYLCERGLLAIITVI